MFRRRKVLGGIAAVPVAASYVGDIAKAEAIVGRQRAAAGYANPVPTPQQLGYDPVRAGAQKALDKLRVKERRHSLHRFGHYYPDIEELRSVSPAAKRFISAARHERERRAEYDERKPFAKILGWITGDEDYDEHLVL